MDIGSIFLVLALAVLVALIIGQPFFRQNANLAASEPTAASELEHRRSGLLAERDRLLSALQELDFDHGLGKIPSEDYPVQRASLLQRAAGVLRALDEIQGEQGIASAEDRVERAVAARRADGVLNGGRPAAPVASKEKDEIEAIIASRRLQRQEKSAGFCPKCGRPVQRSDRFCPSCGAVLQ